MARTPEAVTVDPDLSSRGDLKRGLGRGHFPVPRAPQPIESLADAVPGAPAIVYSTMGDAASVRRSMLAGARDYLIKPVKPEELIRSVHGVLEQEERKRMRMAGQTTH